MTSPVTYDLQGQIARITLDDGKANIMNLAMLTAISSAFDQAERDKAVVLFSSGRPGLFSAGFDLKVFAVNDAEGSYAMVRAGAELALKLLTFPLPIVTACAGHAYPMGAFLILASDIRLAARGAWRIGFNEVAIGIAVPSFALEIGRQRLAPAWLSRAAVTGEMFGPEDALAAGFFDRLVDPADLDAEAAAAAEAAARLHLPSHKSTKLRLRAGAMAAVRAAIDAELTLDAYQSRGPSTVRLPGAA